MIEVKRAVALIALSLSACRPAEPVTSPGPAHPPAPAPAPPRDGRVAVASGAEIAGEWRVAGVAGETIDQPEGIAASVRGDRLRLTAGCVNLEWAMVLAAGRVTFVRRAAEGCGRGLTPVEERVVAAVTSASAAYRLPSNALVFDGPGGALVLFTQ